MTTLREMLRAASRTFALGIERLPGVLGDAVMVAYLLLRVSDYLEDNEHMPAEQKVSLLNLWDRVLAGEADVRQLTALITRADDTNPDAVVAEHAADVLERLRALPPVERDVQLALARGEARALAALAQRT